MPRKANTAPSSPGKKPPSTASRDLGLAIMNDDFAGARRHLAMGGRADARFAYERLRGERMSATAMAAWADSRRDELLFLPWILNRGGNIAEVDAEGRTLLHHVRDRASALYLLENGVPVADGMRDALVEAFRKPSGVGTFTPSKVLAAPTGCDGEPPVFAMVRKKTAHRHALQSSGSVPRTSWPDVLPAGLFEAMNGAGLAEEGGVARARDPLYGVFGPTVSSGVRLNLPYRLLCAMREGDLRRVAALIALGAYDGERVMPDMDGINITDGLPQNMLSAVALAAVLDSEYGSGRPASPLHWHAYRGTGAALYLLPLFDGVADFGGVHAKGGGTLLHLDLAPVVVDWLVERGAPYDVADNDGAVPEELVAWADDPADAAIAAIYARHRLSARLPKGSAKARRNNRRL